MAFKISGKGYHLHIKLTGQDFYFRSMKKLCGSDLPPIKPSISLTTKRMAKMDRFETQHYYVVKFRME